MNHINNHVVGNCEDFDILPLDKMADKFIEMTLSGLIEPSSQLLDYKEVSKCAHILAKAFQELVSIYREDYLISEPMLIINNDKMIVSLRCGIRKKEIEDKKGC